MDDGVADDAGGDGEYWEEHGKSPLLRFCIDRDFPGHTAICKTRAKRKNVIFRQNSQGGELGLYALMDTYTKSYTKIHFRMRCKTQKAPPKRSLKFVSKNANGVRGLSWNAFGPSTGSGTLFIRFCSRLYAMTLHSLTAHEGESRGRACLHMTEPRSRQPKAAIHCMSWSAFGGQQERFRNARLPS